MPWYGWLMAVTVGGYFIYLLAVLWLIYKRS